MSDYAMRNNPPRGGSRLSPPGKAVLEGYRKEMLNGFEKDPARFNPMNAERIQSSALVDLKDPIQVHLLTETALSDSKQYEILSQEEVDNLKKQSQFLMQRVESVQKNLTIQAKYRDAANSMAKLYSPGKGDGRRRSLLGNRHSDHSNKDAEEERLACEKKCEELAAELFNLEKRMMEPQKRLMEHTAGILQLTHKASKRRIGQQNGQAVSGIPGSPESLYTYTQSRNSLDPAAEENYPDDNSLYQLDSLEGQAGRSTRKNAIEIPIKSPVREQNSQLREETERVRAENKKLRHHISATGQKLEGLNGALRDTIIKFNPEVNHDYDGPPQSSDTQGLSPEHLLDSQLDYLDSGLVAVQAEQDSFAGGKDNGERLEAMNLQMRDLLMTTNYHYSPQAMPRDYDVQGQLAYLEDTMHYVDSELARAAVTKTQGKGDPEAALKDLWEFIQSGLTDMKRRKDDRRRARTEKGLEEDEELSDDEEFDTAEAYSLDEFLSRVRWLFRQASTLKDHKSVLKRQIKQQRELNNKSDAEKDSELVKKKEEVEQSRQLVERAEKDALDAQNMLSSTLQDLEEARDAAQSTNGAQVEVLQTRLREMQDSLAAAESDSKSTEGRLAQVDSAIASLSSQLDSALADKQEAEEAAQQLQKDITAKDGKLKSNEAEMEQLSMTVAELKTEVTIARAELDGAYGTRAERAADAAATGQGAEVVRLQDQVGKLKEELTGTITELEDMTKETLGAEREKVELEGQLDDALSVKASLDAEMKKSRDLIARLHEELDGERLKAHHAGPASKPSAGASMLSEQFRATMREERKKFQEDLREERAKARRLEEELGRLKRSMGPGKSPLSPR